jgi:hypothetical protein
MSKFLIVKIANGFGNQMFLYAAAYAFAKKMGYKILIDNETGINHDIHKSKKVKRANWKPKYELDIFTLTSDITENKYKFISYNDHIKRKFLKFFDHFSYKKKFLIEKLDSNKKTSYSDRYLKNKYDDVIFFEGYFESEKYFCEYKDDLQKEFILKSSINLKDNKYYNLICNNNVVSIAFRSRRFTETEKDFKNKEMQIKTEKFEYNTLKYIYRSIDFFKSKIVNPKFLLWSDNFEGLEKHFDPKVFTYVENNSHDKIILDFSLMRKCKYFIVGSTSFHWWSSWLCNDESKIIVCPKDKELNLSCNEDFWPKSWIRI